MKKISVYLLFAIGALLATGVTDFYLTKKHWIDAYHADFAHRSDLLQNEAEFIGPLMDAGYDIDRLREVLELRRSSAALDFWILYHNNQPYLKSLPDSEFENLRIQLNQPEALFLDKQYSYYSHVLPYGFSVTVGLRYAEDVYMKRNFEALKGPLFGSLIAVVCGVFLVFAFFMKDILASIRLLSNRGSRKFTTGLAHSRESEMLMRGFDAYEHQSQNLRAERDQLSSQVLPSLRTELASGRTPPYFFECTMVRTDINNFSTIYNQFPVEPFAALINEFFLEVTHIVGRYNGLIHEFIGDEVIFYFKDEECRGNSPAMAVAAIRDINEVASRYNRKTESERGYSFTVKSALGHGKLRYGRFINGFGLSGPPLIETVRVLSKVNEKDGNLVVFDSRHSESLNAFTGFSEYTKTELKGLTGERTLQVLAAHVPVEHQIETNFENVFFYRSDLDLVSLISWCRARSHESISNSDDVHKVVSLLRNIKVTQTNGLPQQALLLWLEDQLKALETVTTEEGQLRLLSASIRLVENLVPTSEFNGQYAALIERAIHVKDRRIVANALEVQTLHRAAAGETHDSKFAEKLMGHEDGRIAANALVNEGIRQITPFLVRKLRKMLQAKQPSRVAGALYAIGEIAKHHRRVDIIYFETQLEFIELAQSLVRYVSNGDASIRRQALSAAAKLDDAEVMTSLQQMASVDARLSQEWFDLTGLVLGEASKNQKAS